MDLDQAFLEQASMLLEVDNTKPKQVNLRRAVSAAYYAVFHLLVAEAADLVVGPNKPGPVVADLRAQVSRWYGHAEMKQVCEWFRPTGKVPDRVATLLRYPRPGIVPPRLSRVCDTFVTLQEERHKADYDTAYAPKRFAVGSLVATARVAFDDVEALTDDPVYNLFLTLLLTGERVIKAR